MDYNGNYDYSNIAYIEYQSTERKLISVFPNPVDNKLTIRSAHNTKLKIYNHFGSLIKQFDLNEGNNEVDMSEFIEGLYIFRTENEEVERVLKL